MPPLALPEKLTVRGAVPEVGDADADATSAGGGGGEVTVIEID